MDLKIYKGEGFYIIKLNNVLNQAEFEKALDRVLELHGVKGKVGVGYNTFFTEDYAYCVVDFSHKNYTNDQVNKMVKTL